MPKSAGILLRGALSMSNSKDLLRDGFLISLSILFVNNKLTISDIAHLTADHCRTLVERLFRAESDFGPT